MISITLTAYNMGDCDERDFQAWETYCEDHLAPDLGLADVEIGMHNFNDAPERDTISGAAREQTDEIQRWLAVDGWEAFCATPEAWPKRAWRADRTRR